MGTAGGVERARREWAGLASKACRAWAPPCRPCAGQALTSSRLLHLFAPVPEHEQSQQPCDCEPSDRADTGTLPGSPHGLGLDKRLDATACLCRVTWARGAAASSLSVLC